MRRGLMFQWIASSLKPACSCISRAVLSQRNTPANVPLNGTTALLKTLLAVGNGLRGMIGLRVSRQTTPSYPAGLSCHGIFDSAGPTIVAGACKSTRTGERPGTEVAFTQTPFLRKDRKSTRLNSSHGYISYAVFCLKK